MLMLFITFVAAVVLVLLVGFVRMLTNIYDWRLWPAIRRARREVREVARQRVPDADAFSRQGRYGDQSAICQLLDYDCHCQ